MSDDAREAQCPYPGLEAFTADNRHFFFGRANDTQLLISNLYASALTVVYGSSGVGKTSVILAGVVPEVEREGEAAILVHRTWQDADRARSLGARLAALVGERLGVPPIAADVPLDELAERLAAVWRRPIFLVFDQFEEYFLYNEPSDAPDSLDGELARLINRRDVEVNVMIVMREDSIAALDRFRHRIPTLLNNLYRLEHLTAEEARCVIEEPLAVLQARADAKDRLPTTIESGLSVVILDDLAALDRSAPTVGEARDASRVELPFLQVVLERLWLTECRAESSVVRRETFTAAGGAGGIVRQRIAESLNTLPPDEQDIVASVLRNLVTPSGAKIALTMADLTGYAGVAEEQVSHVVLRLSSSDARVLRRVAHPTQNAALTKYEIYHDALGAPLLAWRLEMDRRRDVKVRRAKQIRRDVMIGLGFVAVALIALALSLLSGKRRVEARELASIATSQLESDNGRALLLATESIDRDEDSDAGEVVLRRALFEPGERFRDTVSQPISGLRISPDGRYVVGTSTEGGAALWRTDSLRRIPIPRQISTARSASFDSASRRVLLVDPTRPALLTIDSTVTASFIPRGPGLSGSIPTGHLMRDGRRVLLVYAGAGLVEWTLEGSRWSETARTADASGVPRELVVSPNERWLAWGDRGGVSVIDLEQRPWMVRRLDLEDRTISDFAFVSNDQFAIASGEDTVRVFDAATFSEARVVSLSCRVARFGVANREAAGMCSDAGIVLFNLPNPGSQLRLGEEPPLVNRSTAYDDAPVSPDGRFVAGIGSDASPTIWSVLGRSEATRLRGHRGDVRALAFLPDSRFAITAGRDSTIRKWEIVSAAQRIGDGEWMAGRATVAFNGAAARAAMVGSYGVQLVDTEHGRSLFESPVMNEAVVAVAPSGERMAILNDSLQVQEFSVDEISGVVRWTAPRQSAGVSRANRPISRSQFDGASILRYAGTTGALLLSASQSAAPTDSFPVMRIAADGSSQIALLGSAARAMSVDSSGTVAAVGLADGEVAAIDVTGRSPVERLAPHQGSATAVAIGAGGHVASAGTAGDVHLSFPRSASSATGSRRRFDLTITLGTHDRSVSQLAFNKAGTVLASGDEGGTARLWRVNPRRELCALEGEHADAVRAIAFAPSGATVATADERGVVLWFVDEKNDRCRFAYRLSDLESPTEAMQFAPNGSALVVAGQDGIIRRYARAVWAPRDSLLALAKRRLRGRQLTEAEKKRYFDPK